jgi:glycosyltransferase involved in cell wall biosynthesis
LKSLTVVIPTYNRAQVLKKALEAYAAQGLPEAIHELIVVDDGSTDETKAVVDELEHKAPFPVRYFRQENKGPAAARNVGIREARAEIILFTDSDIVPHRDLVRQHLEWHRRNPEASAAVLGYVTWPPDPPPTPFMRWYGEQGALFSFGEFRGGQELTFLNFYTCNLSLKSEFLRTNGLFDEEFKSAAYEDIELGYRLSKAGLRLLYGYDAVGYHYQFISFADACRKVRRNESASHVFFGKEAGKVYQQTLRTQESPLVRKAASWIGAGIGNLLGPLQGCLDSRVSLPHSVYSFFFRANLLRLKNIEDSRRASFASHNPLNGGGAR